jgi:hypothetical protein
MCRAADGKEFREALNEPENKCLSNCHLNSEPEAGNVGVRRSVVDGRDNVYS